MRIYFQIRKKAETAYYFQKIEKQRVIDDVVGDYMNINLGCA